MAQPLKNFFQEKKYPLRVSHSIKPDNKIQTIKQIIIQFVIMLHHTSLHIQKLL